VRTPFAAVLTRTKSPLRKAEGMQSAENPVCYTTRIESVACLFDALEAQHETLACFKAGAVCTRD
jgi:hypothetical protein